MRRWKLFTDKFLYSKKNIRTRKQGCHVPLMRAHAEGFRIVGPDWLKIHVFQNFRSLHELYKAKAWGSALDFWFGHWFLMIIFSFGYLDVKRSREHFEVALGLCFLYPYFDRTTSLWNMYVSKFGLYYEFEGTKNIYVLKSWIWALEDHD